MVKKMSCFLIAQSLACGGEQLVCHWKKRSDWLIFAGLSPVGDGAPCSDGFISTTTA
jgi:hypothetical protein